MTRARRLTTLAAAALLGALPAAGAEPLSAVRVRTSPAFAPALSPVLAAFTAETGVAAALEVGELDPPGDADVIVGDDSETGRLLEGGVADLSTALDLGELPWVLVAPAGTPPGAVAAASASSSGIAVLGGVAGREARDSLAGTPPGRLRVTRDGAELRRTGLALVPRSLAGEGEWRPADVRPLVATAAAVRAGRDAPGARRLLAFLRTDSARRLLGKTLRPLVAGEAPASAGTHATAVVDSWIPTCSLALNWYNDPGQLLGAPDAANLGGKDLYSGMISLGQGGWVVVDMGAPVADGVGADVRVYQTTANEPVTLYASAGPSGPFSLVGLRVRCGTRTQGAFSNHCDFDLQGSGLPAARYFKVEDGEIYPCLAAGTRSEGADIDAVEGLN